MKVCFVFTKMGSKEWRQQFKIYMKDSAYVGKCFQRLRKDPFNEKKKAEFYRAIEKSRLSRPQKSQEFIELFSKYYQMQTELEKDPFNLKLRDQSMTELRGALNLSPEDPQVKKERHQRYQKINQRFKKYDLLIQKPKKSI